MDASGAAWRGAAGLGSAAPAVPLQLDAVVRIASVTKTFTAAATLVLVQSGRLDLEAAIEPLIDAAYVRQLAVAGYDVRAMTVRHLLAHTSGLPDYASDASYIETVLASPNRAWSRTEQVTWSLTHQSRVGEPGEVVHYSDTGYVLLGEIIERATGLDLGSALRTLVDYDAIGLRHTWLEGIEPVPR